MIEATLLAARLAGGRGSGLGTRDPGFGTRDSGLGVRDSGFGIQFPFGTT
jgi:hypothetical protein